MREQSNARVHGEVGLGNLMPRDAYAEAMGAFYTFNNESPSRPFEVDMKPVLAEMPVEMTTLREWASQQDWTPEGEDKIGSVTA